MKRTEAKSVGSIIDEIINATGNRQTYDEQHACYLWPEIVGPTINHYTLKRYVSDGVLHVHIASAPLKSELQGLRRQLLQRINEAAGTEALKDIAIH